MMSTSLNHNDVLLGRGSGSNEYIGNLRFRSLVSSHKAEFAAASQEDKQVIADSIVEQVTSKGGRFLKETNNSYEQVKKNVALRKCMQALRDKREMLHVGADDIASDISAGTGQAAAPPAAITLLPSAAPGAAQQQSIGPTTTLSSNHGWGQSKRSSPSVADPLSSLRTNNDDTILMASAREQSTIVAAANPAIAPLVHHVQNGATSATTSDVLPSASSVHAFRGLTPVLPTVLNTSGSKPVQAQNLLLLQLQQVLLRQLSLSPQQLEVFQQQQQQFALQQLQPAMKSPTSRVHPPFMQQHVHQERMQLNCSPPQVGMKVADLTQEMKHLQPATNTNYAADHAACTIPQEQQQASVDDNNDDPEFVRSILEVLNNHRNVQNRVQVMLQEPIADEDTAAEALLALLDEPGRPKFTEEQETLERANLTDEEKAAALADIFGRLYAMQKRSKRDLDRSSIQFLVQEMRLEISRIPSNQKEALLEALSGCAPEEFFDERLEHFLRCEGMNTKLGAQRFINYWQRRRQVFGRPRFMSRMTISEALSQEDIVALESGVFRLLPFVDCSGRQIIVIEISRDTRYGYSFENLIRAMWYIMEVAAQNNTNISGGVVHIGHDKHSTMWDLDLKFHERIFRFDRFCWPVKAVAIHTFCAPMFFVKYVKPIVSPLLGKYLRSRVVMHEGTVSEALAELSEYGILQDMLPADMGGTLEFCQADWIANRRSLELTEI